MIGRAADDLRAGFGSAEITPPAGARLVGYAERREPSLGQHDPLLARALVLETGAARVAIVSLELCYVGEDVVRSIRATTADAADIAPDHVFVAATHTHSGPHDADEDNWAGGIAARVAAAIGQAVARLEPATMGAGWGMLHDQSINRRRLEDPVDPAVGVVRIDGARGRPLGLLFTFGCHPVVLGPDNLLASGDWPGHAARSLGARLGPDAVAVFAQAGAADVNPSIVDLERRLGLGFGLAATTPGSLYYGADERAAVQVADRTGGTYEQMVAIGEAVADEVERVHRAIRPARHSGLRVTRMPIDLGAMPDGPPSTAPPHAVERPRARAETPLEVMLIGIGGPGLLLIGQPGEIFAESAVAMRRELRRRGVRFPLPIGCANGWRGYLPPRSAFRDGGYEVEWARAVGVGKHLQDEILAATLELAEPLLV